MRRHSIVGLGIAVLALAACSTESEPGNRASSGSPTVGGSSAGSTPSEDAADDLVVLALDDFAAMNILSLGVEPDLTLEVFGYETSTAIFGSLGLETAPYGAELDLEKVAAAKPDVIIGVSIPTTAALEKQLEAIAPTTILDYTATWQEQLTDTGEALGLAAEADAVQSSVEADLADLAGEIAASDNADAVVSVLGDNDGMFSPPVKTGVGSLIAGAGLERPAAQQAPTDPTSPFVVFSAETLTEQDGDLIFLLSGGQYTTEGFTGSPLWTKLAAVQADAVAEVNAEMWLGTSPFSADWVIQDLRAVLVDATPPATADDAVARFEAFTAG